MLEQDRIAAQIDAEPRLPWSYTLREMPDGAFRAKFYLPLDDYMDVINACRFKPPVDCEVVYVPES